MNPVSLRNRGDSADSGTSSDRKDRGNSGDHNPTNSPDTTRDEHPRCAPTEKEAKLHDPKLVCKLTQKALKDRKPNSKFLEEVQRNARSTQSSEHENEEESS